MLLRRFYSRNLLQINMHFRVHDSAKIQPCRLPDPVCGRDSEFTQPWNGIFAEPCKMFEHIIISDPDLRMIICP